MPTEFEQKIYSLLKQVPKGKVTTYKGIAKKLDSRAYRAVGNALRNNQFAPKIPCHRVVCSDGSLGGYCGSLNNPEKIRLLKKEGVVVRNNKIVNLKHHLYTWLGL